MSTPNAQTTPVVQPRQIKKVQTRTELVTQSSTAAPTSKVITDTTTVTWAWSRSAAGKYRLTPSADIYQTVNIGVSASHNIVGASTLSNVFVRAHDNNGLCDYIELITADYSDTPADQGLSNMLLTISIFNI